LYTGNEESCYKTFQSGCGASNIDLTILNSQAIELIRDWTIYDQERCSDHIKNDLGKGNDFFRPMGTSTAGMRYIVTQRDTVKFRKSVIRIMEQLLTAIYTVEVGAEKLDEALPESTIGTKYRRNSLTP
jgi:hypothetical protein